MTFETLQRPNPGDKVLASWAKQLVEALRAHRLASSHWFDVETTKDGTIVRFTSKKTKKKYKIKLSGTPVQWMLCQKDGGDSYPPAGEQLHDLPVNPMPLGFIPHQITYAGELQKSELYLNEMVDGEPIFDGDFMLGSNNNLLIEIEAEENG